MLKRRKYHLDPEKNFDPEMIHLDPEISDILKIQGENESATEKFISERKKMSKSINDTHTEYASVEDPLHMHRTESNVVTLISEIPNIISK